MNESAQLKPSPFKFLDPYGPEDGGLFFGRSAEIGELYTKLFSAPITVLYGESGTGKTSLIHCGLRNRIPLEDMLFVPVRISDAPEAALRRALLKAAPQIQGDGDDGEHLRRVIRRSYKTVLLVFDQFEEFLLFQAEDERNRFTAQLSGWLEQGLNLRLLFAVRQEYLAQLGALEKHLPGLYDNRLWLRRMSREQAEEVITGPCIGIAPTLVCSLLDALATGGQGVDLPTLQVVLDSLYRQASLNPGTAPVLSLEAYQALGQIHSILGCFLDERIAALGSRSEAAKQVLKTLVTPEATRRSAGRGEIARRLANDFGAPLSETKQNALLDDLVEARILREDPDRHCFELRHDSLAPHVRGWMSVVEQELEAWRTSLEQRRQDHCRRGRSRLLDAAYLADLAPYEKRLALTGELSVFVQASKDALQQEAVKRQRHRLRMIVGTALGFLLLVSGFGGFSFVQWREAERQKQQAETSFQKARQAVDEFYTQISEIQLLNKPAMEPLRRQLLEKALKYYQDMSTMRTDDAEMQATLADAASRLANINQILGNGDGALVACRKAIELLDRLVKAHPAVADYQTNLATNYSNLGVLQKHSGDRDGARASYQKAIELRERLDKTHPDVPDYQLNLAKSYNNLGILQVIEGDRRRARASHRKAIELRERLAKAHPDAPDYQSDLAQSHNNLGLLLKDVGDRNGALASYRKAIELRERLAKAYPDVPDYQSALATSYNSLGILQADDGDGNGARESYQKAIGFNEALVKAHPDVPDYQNLLAVGYNSLGILQADSGNRDGARASYRKAIELRERLAKAHPDVPDYQSALAASYNSLGAVRADDGDSNGANASYQKAIELRERLVKAHPDVPAYQSALAQSYHNLGLLLDDGGDRDGARASYRKAIELRERLAKAYPTIPDYQNDLAQSYNNLGLLQKAGGDRDGARASYQKAIELRERLTKAHPDVPDYQSALAGNYKSLGFLLTDGGDHNGARKSFLQAITVYERLAREHADQPAYRNKWAGTEGNLSWNELLDRKPAAAIASANRALDLDPKQIWIKTNLAHGLLFEGRYEKALKIYTENRDVKLPEQNDKTFGEVVLDDFEQLRAKDITHPDMAKIKKLLQNRRSPKR